MPLHGLWETLPEGTKIVDVGGGIGTACREIMKKNPLLKFTLQDLPGVTDDAVAVSILTFTFGHMY
jgi:16S rRNA G1207 methylase RsmC